MSRSLPQIRRGEIWRAHEGAGSPLKARHVLVISADSLQKTAFRTILPLARDGSRRGGSPWTIRIEPHESNGLEVASDVDASRIGPLPVSSFIDRIGTVTPEELEEVSEAVSMVIECW